MDVLKTCGTIGFQLSLVAGMFMFLTAVLLGFIGYIEALNSIWWMVAGNGLSLVGGLNLLLNKIVSE